MSTNSPEEPQEPGMMPRDIARVYTAIVRRHGGIANITGTEGGDSRVTVYRTPENGLQKVASITNRFFRIFGRR